MRQEHARDACRELGFVAREPADLGDGERRDGHTADRISPGLRATPLRDEVGGILRRARVIPQQRRPDDLTRLVEGDHAVLLRRDGHRLDIVEQPVTGLRERGPPVVGMHLGAIRVGRPTLANECTGVGIPYDDLDGLGGGVDSGDEGHGATLPLILGDFTAQDRVLALEEVHIRLESVQGIADSPDLGERIRMGTGLFLGLAQRLTLARTLHRTDDDADEEVEDDEGRHKHVGDEVQRCPWRDAHRLLEIRGEVLQRQQDEPCRR